MLSRKPKGLRTCTADQTTPPRGPLGLPLHSNPQAEGDLKARVLCFHGGRDPFVPDSSLLAFKQEMDAKGAAYELVVFGPCLHAFTRPDKTAPEDKAAGFFYDPEATQRSWEGTRKFLAEVLGSKDQ